ncbi:MAG: hypothetical protein ACC628_15510 [Pirellulaceae bacterium]
MMTFWVIAWKLVLILTLAGFAVMAVCVTIGGAVDVRNLLRRLQAGDDEGEGS